MVWRGWSVADPNAHSRPSEMRLRSSQARLPGTDVLINRPTQNAEGIRLELARTLGSTALRSEDAPNGYRVTCLAVSFDLYSALGCQGRTHPGRPRRILVHLLIACSHGRAPGIPRGKNGPANSSADAQALSHRNSARNRFGGPGGVGEG